MANPIVTRLSDIPLTIAHIGRQGRQVRVAHRRFGTAERVSVKVAPRLLVNSVDATIDAVVGGLGIGRVLSYQVAEHLAAGRLVEVLPDDAPYPVPINLVFQANRQRSPNVRAFIAEAKARIPPQLH